MAGKDNLVPFKKGDSRINRKGRPKNFDEWRKLGQDIFNEMAVDKDGNPILHVVTGEPMSRAEAYWRALGSNTKKAELVLAYLYGKPPDKLEVGGADGQPIPLVIIRRADEPTKDDGNE